MLLDGIPIYNVNHMFGFFSAFNTDAVRMLPSTREVFRHVSEEDFSSSVVDVRMKDDKNFHGNVSVGLISSKFNLKAR